MKNNAQQTYETQALLRKDISFKMNYKKLIYYNQSNLMNILKYFKIPQKIRNLLVKLYKNDVITFKILNHSHHSKFFKDFCRIHFN